MHVMSRDQMAKYLKLLWNIGGIDDLKLSRNIGGIGDLKLSRSIGGVDDLKLPVKDTE